VTATATTTARHRRSARRASDLFQDLIVDYFAGGGGASVGIEAMCEKYAPEIERALED